MAEARRCVYELPSTAARIQLVHDNRRAVLRSQRGNAGDLIWRIDHARRIVGIREEECPHSRFERVFQLPEIEARTIGVREVIHAHRHHDTTQKLDELAIGEVVGTHDGHAVARRHQGPQREKQRALSSRCDDQFIRSRYGMTGEGRQALRDHLAQLGATSILRICL